MRSALQKSYASYLLVDVHCAMVHFQFSVYSDNIDVRFSIEEIRQKL